MVELSQVSKGFFVFVLSVVVLFNVMIFTERITPSYFTPKRDILTKMEVSASEINNNVTSDAEAEAAIVAELITLIPSLVPVAKTIMPTTQSPQLKAFLRAAVVYMPHKADPEFIAQIRWFHRSWIEMAKHEKDDWHTDIIVITEKKLPVLDDLNCTTAVRRSRNESNRCVVVEGYVSVKKRFNEFKDYNYADSVAALIWDTSAMDQYDWILRTDMDTFLTPAFASWRPEKMIVGKGSYCFDGYITCHRLKRIARDMNLTDAGYINVGSTWYGPTKIVRSCANLSVEAMRYLHNWEFSKVEYSKKFLTTMRNWPEWHHGVLTMYGGQLAINHCAREFGFEKRPDLLDVPTTSSESVYDHPHLHTWQDGNRFSKFSFMNGAYQSENLSALDLTKISDYAVYISLDAHRNRTIGT